MASVPHHGGKPNLQKSEVMRKQSAFLRAECQRLIAETIKQSKDMQNDHNQTLGKRVKGHHSATAVGVGIHILFFCSDQRVKEVQFMKTELELRLDEIIVETDELITLQTRVAKALETTMEPLRVTNFCLEERSDCKMMEIERRQTCLFFFLVPRMKLGLDMQQDEVNLELLNERMVIEGVASALQRVSEEITEQIRRVRWTFTFFLNQDVPTNMKSFPFLCQTEPIC